MKKIQKKYKNLSNSAANKVSYMNYSIPYFATPSFSLWEKLSLIKNYLKNFLIVFPLNIFDYFFSALKDGFLGMFFNTLILYFPSGFIWPVIELLDGLEFRLVLLSHNI